MAASKSISDAARALSARRKTFAGGRPAKLVPCIGCGHALNASQRRAACPHCGKRHPRQPQPAVPASAN